MRKAVIFKDRAFAWRYRLLAANGEVIAQSEAYTRKGSARRAILRNHPEVMRIEVE